MDAFSGKLVFGILTEALGVIAGGGVVAYYFKKKIAHPFEISLAEINKKLEIREEVFLREYYEKIKIMDGFWNIIDRIVKACMVNDFEAWDEALDTELKEISRYVMINERYFSDDEMEVINDVFKTCDRLPEDEENYQKLRIELRKLKEIDRGIRTVAYDD